MNNSSKQTRRRIHLVTQTFPPRMGGMEAVMHSLATKFASHENEVHVYLNHPYHGKDAFTTHYKPCPKLVRAPIKKRAVTCKSNANDLFICDSWKSANALPRHAKHVVILAHGQEYLQSSKRHARIKKAFSHASHIVSASAFTLGLIQNGWNIAGIKSAVTHPTYSLPNETANLATKNKGVPIQLLTISRIESRKGLAPVIRYLGEYHDKLPAFQWNIAGTGPQLEMLKQLVTQYGLTDCIHFKGHVSEEEKETLLSNTDLFIMPSYQEGNSLEGFGISYVEAARYGVPAIAGIAGGAKEAVKHLETGWCIDPLDKDSLELTMKEALANRELREKLGKAAQERYATELAGDKVFAAFKAFIAS